MVSLKSSLRHPLRDQSPLVTIFFPIVAAIYYMSPLCPTEYVLYPLLYIIYIIYYIYLLLKRIYINISYSLATISPSFFYRKPIFQNCLVSETNFWLQQSFNI